MACNECDEWCSWLSLHDTSGKGGLFVVPHGCYDQVIVRDAMYTQFLSFPLKFVESRSPLGFSAPPIFNLAHRGLTFTGFLLGHGLVPNGVQPILPML